MWVLQQRPLLEGTYSHADATPPPAQQVRTYPCCPWDTGWDTGGHLHPSPSILPSYILPSLTSYLPTYSELNPNTAKNHPLRLSEERPSRLLYGARLPITYRALAP